MDHVNKQVDRLESIVLCQKKGKNWDGQPPTPDLRVSDIYLEGTVCPVPEIGLGIGSKASKLSILVVRRP